MSKKPKYLRRVLASRFFAGTAAKKRTTVPTPEDADAASRADAADMVVVDKDAADSDVPGEDGVDAPTDAAPTDESPADADMDAADLVAEDADQPADDSADKDPDSDEEDSEPTEEDSTDEHPSEEGADAEGDGPVYPSYLEEMAGDLLADVVMRASQSIPADEEVPGDGEADEAEGQYVEDESTEESTAEEPEAAEKPDDEEPPAEQVTTEEVPLPADAPQAPAVELPVEEPIPTEEPTPEEEPPSEPVEPIEAYEESQPTAVLPTVRPKLAEPVPTEPVPTEPIPTDPIPTEPPAPTGPRHLDPSAITSIVLYGDRREEEEPDPAAEEALASLLEDDVEDRRALVIQTLWGVLRRALVFVAIALVSVAISQRLVTLAAQFLGGYSDGSTFNRFWCAHIFACLFIGGSLWFNRDWFETKPHNLYLVIALAITLLFSFGISIRTVGWDIGVHMRNIIAFADTEGKIERSASDISIINVSHIKQREAGWLSTIDATEASLDGHANKKGASARRKTSALWYVTGVEYVPYALILRLCRWLGVGYAAALVFVRMVGGIIYSLVTWAGMRKLRRGQMIFACVALIPTNMFLASEFGYTYWLLGFVLYGFASLAGMIQGSVEARPRSLILMLAALFVGMLPRVAYFPLMFLCLLIPTERFSSRRVAYVYRGLLVGAALGALATWLVPRLIDGFGSGDARGGGGVNPDAQIEYILAHPAEYAQMLIRLILPPFAMQGGGADVEGMSPVSGLLSLEAMPGLLVNYGYLTRPAVEYSVVVGGVLVAVTLFDKDPDHPMGWARGVVAVVVVLAITAMIATALYIDFTPVGLEQIQGMQRRYLLPLVYPLLLFVGPALRVRIPRGAFNAAVLCTMAAVLLDSWWTCALSYIV